MYIPVSEEQRRSLERAYRAEERGGNVRIIQQAPIDPEILAMTGGCAPIGHSTLETAREMQRQDDDDFCRMVLGSHGLARAWTSALNSTVPGFAKYLLEDRD